MRFVYQATIVLLVVISNNVAITLAQRAERGLDFGDLLRNLLLKSSSASNVKGNIARNVVNLKNATPAPRRRTTSTTTTTTMAPLFVKGPFRFPFDLSNYGPVNKFNPANKFNNGGYLNFDYNDYGPLRPVRPARKRRPTTTTTTTSTTTTTTTPAPPPARRRPLPPIRYGRFGKQKLLNFNYYDDDYDYNYDDDDTVTSETPAPPPPPPSPRPRRPPTANRARNQGRLPQLRTKLVYQYRQPDDTSTNDEADDDGNAASATNVNEDNSETSANTNDNNNDDDTETTNDNNASADPNNVEDYNDSSDNANVNANDDVSLNNDNVDNSNFNSPNPPPLPYYHPQLAAGANFGGIKAQTQFDGPGPGNNNFGASAGFNYPSYSDFTTQYQSHSPNSYSTRYY